MEPLFWSSDMVKGDWKHFDSLSETALWRKQAELLQLAVELRVNTLSQSNLPQTQMRTLSCYAHREKLQTEEGKVT